MLKLQELYCCTTVDDMWGLLSRKTAYENTWKWGMRCVIPWCAAE